MDFTHDDQNWNRLTYKEKNHQLFLKQKAVRKRSTIRACMISWKRWARKKEERFRND